MADKVALITGAGRAIGLGVATARLLGEQDHHVLVTARRQEQAEEQAAMLRGEGLSAEGILLDLSDTDSFAGVAARIQAEHGRLDVLVNNASTMPDFGAESLLDVDIAAVKLALDIDVVATWALVQATRHLLEAAAAARVVNVTSGVAPFVTDPEAELWTPAHAFAKHSLEVLTVRLAVAFRGTNVLVNAADPGRVATHPEFGVDDEDRPAAESAVGVVWAATLPEGGPTGGVFLDGAPRD